MVQGGGPVCAASVPKASQGGFPATSPALSSSPAGSSRDEFPISTAADLRGGPGSPLSAPVPTCREWKEPQEDPEEAVPGPSTLSQVSFCILKTSHWRDHCDWGAQCQWLEQDNGSQPSCLLPAAGEGKCLYLPQNCCVWMYVCLCVCVIHWQSSSWTSWQAGGAQVQAGYQEERASVLVSGRTCECGVPVGRVSPWGGEDLTVCACVYVSPVCGCCSRQHLICGSACDQPCQCPVRVSRIHAYCLSLQMGKQQPCCSAWARAQVPRALGWAPADAPNVFSSMPFSRDMQSVLFFGPGSVWGEIR